MKTQPSTLNLFARGLKLGLSNIWRNKFLSLATIFVIGIIIFIFNIILAVNFIAKEAILDLSKKIDITVYLKEDAAFKDALNIISDIKGLEGIDNVTYTSKEDALIQIKKTHPDLSIAFEKYGLKNPLPASLNITTIDPSYHSSIAEFLKQDKYKIYLSNIVTSGTSTNEAILTSVSKNLQKVSGFTQQVIFWLIVIFIIGGTLVILNALQITIFSRKKEISVMKLVGASYTFIKLPFIIESVIYGILSVMVSFIMLLILSQKIKIQQTSLWNYYSGMDFYIIFLGEVLITIVLCVASSMFAVHEYLHTKHIE